MVSSFSLCSKFLCTFLQCTRENLNYCLTSSFPEIILGPSVVDTRYHSEPSLEKGGGGAEELLLPPSYFWRSLRVKSNSSTHSNFFFICLYFLSFSLRRIVWTRVECLYTRSFIQPIQKWTKLIS